MVLCPNVQVLVAADAQPETLVCESRRLAFPTRLLPLHTISPRLRRVWPWPGALATGGEMPAESSRESPFAEPSPQVRLQVPAQAPFLDAEPACGRWRDSWRCVLPMR